MQGRPGRVDGRWAAFTLVELLVVTKPPRPPWVPFDATNHYPARHSGRMASLFHDGHVVALRPATLRVGNFREPGSGPDVPGYPGE